MAHRLGFFAVLALACLAGADSTAECAEGGEECLAEDTALLQVKQVPVGDSPAVPNYCGGTGGPGAQYQSPINIDSKVAYGDVGAQPTFYAQGGGCDTAYFAANWKEWKAKFVSGGHPVNCSNLRMSYQGTVYTMVQLLLRSGSEDHVDGTGMPMQMTMVHISADAQYVAVSVLIKSQSYVKDMNPFLKNIFQSSRIGSGKVTPGLYNPYQMLTPGGKFWAYKGSTTQTPCLPGINWLVAQDQVALSSGDISNYRTYLLLVGQGFGNNNRPIQPLNGRTIQVGTFGPTITDDSQIPPFPGWGQWKDLVRAIEF